GRVAVRGTPVVDEYHDAGQARVEILPHHQLADPGTGPPVHLAQLVADHVLPQRVERDRPVRYLVDPPVEAARHADRYRHQGVGARVDPHARGTPAGPGHPDQAERVAA